MAQKVPRPIVLAYDLGGTKVAVGVVDDRGKVLDEVRVPVRVQEGKKAVLRQLCDLGKTFLAEYPSIRRIGFASAGPLDPESGTLLDPTNFVSAEGSWGKVAIGSYLSRCLGKPVFVENDAAAAMLAESWIGAARGYENAMILTLGTGLGTGMVTNGSLVRAGQMMHPEAGHMIIGYNDSSAPCGCGNLGCAEAYLSGRNFTRRARARFGDASLDAREIAELARKRDPRALASFDEYAYLMAIAIRSYAVLYCPEVVVLTGSFANASDLFLEKTRKHLEKLLERRRVGVDLLPKLIVSKLHNQAGVIGAAYIAFHRETKRAPRARARTKSKRKTKTRI